MNEKITLKKVTRYNGKVGYDVLVEGARVGEVHLVSAGRWAFSASKQGVYASGSWCRTRSSAVRALAGACGAEY